MVNKITRENAKELNIDFNYLLEDFYCESYSEHRKGSNFYTRSIVLINEEYFPDVSRELDGFWETNTYIHDDYHGHDMSDIQEVTRVEKKEIVVTTTEWVPIQ